MRHLSHDDRTRLFHAALRRIRDRADSLRLFYGWWTGTGAGIEGWLKVEFVAAMNELGVQLRTGGAGGRGRAGGVYSDLILEGLGAGEVAVELKATGTIWSPRGGSLWRDVEDLVLVFLCPSEDRLIESRLALLRERDPEVLVSQVCPLEAKGSRGEGGFYFGLMQPQGQAT